jgi:hypothetical protein
VESARAGLRVRIETQPELLSDARLIGTGALNAPSLSIAIEGSAKISA